VRCYTSTDFVVKPFSFTIAHVVRNITGKRVGENNTQQFTWHWPGDDVSILPMVTLIVDTTMLSMVNTAIARRPDSCQQIPQLGGCREEPNGDGGLCARNVTPRFNINSAAG